MDLVTSEEEAGRLRLKYMCTALKRRRLRWIRHMHRRWERDVLVEVCYIEVDGRRPRCRPRNTWKDTVRDGMRELVILEDLAMERDEWRRTLDRLTSHGGNT